MHNHQCFKIVTLFLFFIVFEQAFATNLRDAIDSAQANNRNIKLEQIKLNSIKTEKTKAIAEFLPNISANISHGQRNSFYQGQSYDRSTKQNSEEIKIEQPIFDGLHSISKYREANYKIKSSSARNQNKIQEISFATVQSYCNLFRYQELLKIRKENKELGKNFFNLVKRRKEVRIIDNADIIKFSYETSLTDEKYLDALNRLNKAKFDYQNLVGELNENLVKPEILVEEFDKNKILELALANNHNIKSYHYNYLANKAALNAEKANFLPKISIVASASKQDKVVYLNNQDLNSKSVFVNVAIPIFQKGFEYANTSKARYDRDIAKEEYEISKDDISKEINQAFEEYNFFFEINKTNKKLFEMSIKRAEIFKKRLKSKIEDPVEAIRAYIEANDRKINYIDSEIDLVIAQYKIKYFLGEI
jgi:outer membrane protein TolC